MSTVSGSASSAFSAASRGAEMPRLRSSTSTVRPSDTRVVLTSTVVSGAEYQVAFSISSASG
ncbi:hypothetical protein ACWEFL_20380 [Streptomyces sp. NPDC004838]